MNKTLATIDVAKLLTIKLSVLCGIALVLCGCMSGLAPSQPGGPKRSAPEGKVPTAVVLLDTSGSVLNTDIPAMAETKLSGLVATMPVGSRVVLRGVNSNVTAMCQDLTISLPRQPSGPVEDQVRQANQAAIPGKFKRYTDCSAKQDEGGTEFWGGLAETYAFYPNAQIYAYSDTCENVTIRPGTCVPKKLRDRSFPHKVLAKLAAQGLLPQLEPGSTITFIGVGRNTGLRADEVAALRRIAAQYAQRAGATATFETK